MFCRESAASVGFGRDACVSLRSVSQLIVVGESVGAIGVGRDCGVSSIVFGLVVELDAVCVGSPCSSVSRCTVVERAMFVMYLWVVVASVVLCCLS